MMHVGLRKRGRSAIQPPANFAMLESPSETPSITPSANAGAPRLARNAGRIAVAASWPQSEKRLASPMPSTPRVSQLLGGGIGAGRDAGEGTFMVHAPRVSAPRLRQRAPAPPALPSRPRGRWRKKRNSRRENIFGPLAPRIRIEPQHRHAQIIE